MEAVRVEKILHVGGLIEEVAMRFESTTTDANVDVAVIRFACLECRREQLEEMVATLGVCPCAGDGEIVHEETDNAVVVVCCLVDEAARISGGLQEAPLG